MNYNYKAFPKSAVYRIIRDRRHAQSDDRYPFAVNSPPKKLPVEMAAENVEFIFSEKNVSESRYSDGSIKVYYTAEEKETCAKETGYHFRELYKSALESGESVSGNQLLVKVQISGSCRDYFEQNSAKHQLCIDPPQGYNICRSIGAEAASDQIQSQIIVVPAARHKNARSIAVFCRNAILNIVCANELKYEASGLENSIKVTTNRQESYAIDIDSWFF